MAKLTLSGELGRCVSITVHGRERATAADRHDPSWLRCSVEVAAGAFRGAVAASFLTDDFARFLAELDGVLRGERATACFTTMEQALGLRVQVDRAGSAIVTGRLREPGEDGSELSFVRMGPWPPGTCE